MGEAMRLLPSYKILEDVTVRFPVSGVRIWSPNNRKLGRTFEIEESALVLVIRKLAHEDDMSRAGVRGGY